jgi:hypothetical protein
MVNGLTAAKVNPEAFFATCARRLFLDSGRRFATFGISINRQ